MWLQFLPKAGIYGQLHFFVGEAAKLIQKLVILDVTRENLDIINLILAKLKIHLHIFIFSHLLINLQKVNTKTILT